MWLMNLFVVCVGLILGSFYNVVAVRLLNKQSVVYPPSHCPACQQRLKIIDLVPVVSYVWLRGRCRHCQASISPLYPLGELLTGAGFYLTYVTFGFSAELIIAFGLVSLLVISVLTDLRQKLILDKITFSFVGFLFIGRLFIGEEPFWFYVLGSIGGFALLFLLAVISRGGMGGGDIKLYVAIGLALGPWMTLLSLVLASFAGAVIGGVLLIIGKVKRKEPIPFAPFIAIGTLTAYLYGESLWLWYVQLF